MSKKIVLIFCMLLLVLTSVSAKGFIVHNASDESQDYFVVNGTTGNVGSSVAKLDVKGDVNIYLGQDGEERNF